MTRLIDNMTDYERGEYDAIHDHDERVNDHPDYHKGFNAEFFKGVSDEQKGAIDCKLGFAHAPNQSKEYDNGYQNQYAIEQNASHHSERGRL